MHLLSGTMSSAVHIFTQHSGVPWGGGHHYRHVIDKQSENKLSKLPEESQLICGQGGI